MRVIAGAFKGRVLKAPEGTGTRPTIDRVKESLMSSIYSLRGGFEDAVVLDAFAGSGALGIESLSRGARRAWFFEVDRRALEALNANIAMLKLPQDTARVFRQDVLKNPPYAAGAPFDLVFLDPPYAYAAADVLAMVQTLKEQGSLAPGCIVSYEHSNTSDNLSNLACHLGLDIDILATKKNRTTAIDLFRFASQR